MDDEPMWAADRVVALTPGFVITIPDIANEFAIKGYHLSLIKETNSMILRFLESDFKLGTQEVSHKGGGWCITGFFLQGLTGKTVFADLEKERKLGHYLLMAVLQKKSSQTFSWHWILCQRDLGSPQDTVWLVMANSKKMQKAVLKQQCEAFYISSKEKLRDNRHPTTATPGLADETWNIKLADCYDAHKDIEVLQGRTGRRQVRWMEKHACGIDKRKGPNVSIATILGILQGSASLKVQRKVDHWVEQTELRNSIIALMAFTWNNEVHCFNTHTCPSNDSDGELGAVSDHSVNDDPIHDHIPIPSIEQVTIATQKTQPQVSKPKQTVTELESTKERELGLWDYYERKMAREAALKSQRVVHADVRQATPAWTNTNRDHSTGAFGRIEVFFDSGCSGHGLVPNLKIIRNYQLWDSDTFGGSKGSISGKGGLCLIYGVYSLIRWAVERSAFLYGIYRRGEKHGYRRGTIDKTLFIKKDKKDIILVQIYVDDIIFGSTKKSWSDKFEALMKGRFQMSAMGELTFFLGLQVKAKPRKGSSISQTMIMLLLTLKEVKSVIVTLFLLASSKMPKSIHKDHQDTTFYIPKYHRTEGLSDADRAIFKSLERRFFHEGRAVHSSFLDDSNIPQVFFAINFDCLLNIDEEICPLFVLELYKSVRITQNVDQTISIAFIIRNLEIVLPLHHFAQILRVPCEGACMYTVEWSIASLSKSIDPNPVYHTPLDDPILVRDAIFYEDPLPNISPKRETILSENVISLSRNKDHPNACLIYMLYCIATQKPFNLAYYIAKRMVGVIKNDMMVLPYGMLLTRLYRHVLTIQPCPLTDGHFLTTHVMVPLTEGHAKRILVDGKRPHP
ncbi:ribonuclease H-like domain-containing protein [Tanacetum coccineum]